MNRSIIKEGILGVLRLRWHSWFTNYRKKVSNTQARHQTAGPLSANEVLAGPK
jgi:dolichol-phosphate mannosyltransferase